jgi:hypothetical protein
MSKIESKKLRARAGVRRHSTAIGIADRYPES